MPRAVEVFDPAMCCATGVCGPNPDPKLVRFAADLDWLTRRGADVRRYNLAHQPVAFATNTTVKALLASAGTRALPAILVNGRLVSQGRYPARAELVAMTETPEGQPTAALPAPAPSVQGVTPAVGHAGGCGCGPVPVQWHKERPS